MRTARIILITLLSLFFISFIVSKLDTKEVIMQNKIAVIPIKGAITVEGTGDFFSGSGVSSNTVTEFIKKSNEDESIKGIILEINSPGGGVVASEEIANAVKESKKPVVSWIREVGASGAYWVASASDAIVADPLSLTGSIGVTSSYLSFGELLEDYNVTYQRLVTGKYKDLATPFKELTNEERALLEKKLYDIHDYFVAEVARNRDLPEENVRALATGEFFLGQEALPLGLVDYLGGKETAMNITKQLANITSAEEKVYKEKLGFLDVFSSFAESWQPKQMELQIR